MKRTGGRVLVDQLRLNGIDRVFCVPGESYLAVLDALYDSGIDVVVCRHEGGAAMMAEAYAKVTGRPGICMVTRGPGATNASSGIHVARHDSTPVIMFVGQVGRDMRHRDAFQEVDLVAMFTPLAKWAAEIHDAARMAEYVSRAFHVSQSARAGPVVLSLPEDMLTDEVEVEDAPPARIGVAMPDPADIARMVEMLTSAERPVVLLGGAIWSNAAAEDLITVATALDLPVANVFRRQDYLDNRHRNYAGDCGIAPNPALAERIRSADLILALGTRLGETATSGYTLMTPPRSRQCLIHVHVDPNELGRVYHADLAIAASAPSVLAALVQQLGNREPMKRPGWTDAMRADCIAWRTPKPTPGKVRLEAVIQHLGERLPEDAFVTNGAGNYAAFLHRYYPYRRYRTLVAPTSGSMGYGLPAAIAAKLAHPERVAVCLAGDGCFQMTCQELATAAQVGAHVVILVVNNGIYGTIRTHQERHYPGRVVGTNMTNPDFAALARSYGALGETVERTEDFPAALERALSAGSAALIDLRTDPEALSPTATISGLRERATT